MDVALYVVATPLGNLGDLSPRARETLSRASFLAVESRDVGKRWLEILKPETGDWQRPRLLSYRESSRERDSEVVLGHLRDGFSVALISDAGTPAVSDPGWELVDLVRQEDLPVIAIPGPCAAIQALSMAGLPSRYFHFEGFLPASGSKRQTRLRKLKSERSSCLLYESPHRLLDTLKDLELHCPDRTLLVARELTKKFEESWRGSTSNAAVDWKDKVIKGEFSLVLGPIEEKSSESTEVSSESLDFMVSLGLPTKTATAVLKHFYPEANKKQIYQALVESSASKT